jgi:transglutaminase-like putative cysteine protease
MKLNFESEDLSDYLPEIPPLIQYSTPDIQELIRSIKARTDTKNERARLAFEFVRDEIRHSFDTGFPGVTIGATQVLEQKEGICFAKSHLLASLLRGMDIPTGFCYQRVLRKGTIESGYALHGLNALYLDDIGWIRVDPRGNKPGIDSQFSMETEKLAYPIRTELGEVDYPGVYTVPLPSVIKSMIESNSSQELFFNRPEKL